MSATSQPEPDRKPGRKNAGKPIWPKIPSPFVRAILAGHSSLGLAFAALIYLVCFSGTAVVLLEEVARWETPQIAPIESMSPQAIETLRAEAMAKHPGKLHHIFTQLPTDASPRTIATLDIHEGPPYEEWVADRDGHLVAPYDTPFTTFIQSLHIYLHLPNTWGLFVVGLTGVALLSSLISGLLAHPRVFRDAFHLRWGGSKRLQEADMHNRIGIWALPFHIVISLTGALLGLTTILMGALAFAAFKGDVEKAYSFFYPPTVADNPSPAPPAPIQPMFDHIEKDTPGTELTYITFEHPGETGQSVQITGHKPNALNNGVFWVFGGDGKLLDGGASDKGTIGNNILQALNVLHFGWFGGWPVKIAYILLGSALTVLTASGVAIWLARRRDKGRPAPGWERVWSAFCWSQPPSYAIAALIAMMAPAVPLAPVWLGASLVLLAAAIVWRPDQISVRLRLLGALLLAAVPIVHIALHGTAVADPVSAVIDAAFAGLAVLLGVSLLNPLRRPASPAPQPAE